MNWVQNVWNDWNFWNELNFARPQAIGRDLKRLTIRTQSSE
jgi:hypothetical protein